MTNSQLSSCESAHNCLQRFTCYHQHQKHSLLCMLLVTWFITRSIGCVGGMLAWLLWWTVKDLEVKGNIPAFSWRDRGNPQGGERSRFKHWPLEYRGRPWCSTNAHWQCWCFINWGANVSVKVELMCLTIHNASVHLYSASSSVRSESDPVFVIKATKRTVVRGPLFSPRQNSCLHA